MSQKTFSIPNISCGHCINAIKGELLEIDGVTQVDGNADQRNITVQWNEPVTEGAIIARLQKINYPAE